MKTHPQQTQQHPGGPGPDKPPEILIIGGGIGGLCLAHGLLKADPDVGVTVFERTVERTDWLQGYRIHINPDGAHALNSCLPEANWQRFVTTVSADEDGGFGFVTPGLAPLLDIPRELVDRGAEDPVRRHHGVSRIRLREALLQGLGDDHIQFGRTFERYELRPDGRVTAHFADGGSATGDLLIGADGANSRVRGQLLPQADRIDTGVVCVAGKFPLTPESRARLPLRLTTRANNVIPSAHGSLFTAVWQPDTRTPAPPPPSDGIGTALSTDLPYTIWGYSDSADRMPVDGLDPAALKALVGHRIADWHPGLRELVSGADPGTVNAFPVLSAPPSVDPWPTGPVTLLGDAVHSMTPMAGIGANTALRDAELLTRVLTEAASGRRQLPDATAEYEERMRGYGFAAVRLSLRNARQAGHAGPLARRAFRTVLRTAEALPPLKRRMFADLGSSPDQPPH
jgi:2-polyprenyl-6-methoxyphenol hydroxylase-like FAD-dependent oxidoreductase